MNRNLSNKNRIMAFMPLIATILWMSCTDTTSPEGSSDVWSNAKWIAYEQLQDSMKVVPGVHGSGDALGHRSKDRSIVPLFRKDFTVRNKVKSASISISGLGHYELYLNGARVGDRFLSPGWTNYQKRILYNTYDLTPHVKDGGNAIGVLVGNGFYYINRERYRKLVIAYGYPKLIFNIRIEYEDGSADNIVSDENCKVAPSPITFSSIYGGEDYDATMEQPGWNNFGFDDSKWKDPVLIDDPRENLVPEKDFPLKVMQKFNTHRIFK